MWHKIKFSSHSWPHINTLCNRPTDKYHILLQEYPSSRTSCPSLYMPYAYRVITLSHSLNLCTCTLQICGLEASHYIRFSTEETYISKIICTRMYCIQSDTWTKSWHFVLHAHMHLTYSLKHNINQNIYTYITTSSHKNLPFTKRK
jgi:hypothetical protein